MVAACELEIQGGAEKRESDGAGSPPEHNALYFPEELSMIATKKFCPITIEVLIHQVGADEAQQSCRILVCSPILSTA